jgi:hypothetical protein
MACVGIKSRVTFDALVKSGSIPVIRVGTKNKMVIVTVSPHDWIWQKAREQSPPRPRGRPTGIKAPPVGDRPKRLGRPPGSKDRMPRRRHGTMQQPAEAVLLAASSGQ